MPDARDPSSCLLLGGEFLFSLFFCLFAFLKCIYQPFVTLLCLKCHKILENFQRNVQYFSGNSLTGKFYILSLKAQVSQGYDRSLVDLSHSWRSPWEAAHVSVRACCTQTHTSAPSSLSHIGTNLPPGELRGQCPVSTVMGGWLPWGRTFSAFSLIGLLWLHIRPLLLNWSLCSITSTVTGMQGVDSNQLGPSRAPAASGDTGWAQSLQNTWEPGWEALQGKCPSLGFVSKATFE